MIYLDSIVKKETITNKEKDILDTLSNDIGNVLTNMTKDSECKNSKEVLFQYVIENISLG